MAKVSPVSIKYMVYANFEAEGAIEKPDVIGAIFGQTEGLLGSDLEMRELQKEGKIGRIEVQTNQENSKTLGKIQIPSALDKTETTLIAAAIETIERIGPSNAKVQVEKIEDVRENKREYILERAKKLLESIEEKMPKSREMTENIKTESRTSKLQEYGNEKLPAGNLQSREIIVVEGRADVINLLRNGIDNVIGMNGTILPETIKELSYSKEITLFLDGDRGGQLIAKNVADNAKISYLAFAPDGKEVEELTGKEIILSIRRKIPIQEFFSSTKREKYYKFPARKNPSATEESAEISEVNLESHKDRLKQYLEEIKNTKSAIILDKKLELIDKVSTRMLFSSLSKTRNPHILIIDTATPPIVRIAENNNIKNILAKNFTCSSQTVNFISL